MPGVPSRRELAQFTDWGGRAPNLMTWWPQARWPARAHARHHESTRHELTKSRRISPLSVTDRWEILPRFTKAHHRPPGRTQATPYTTGMDPADPTRRTRIQCWAIKNATFFDFCLGWGNVALCLRTVGAPASATSESGCAGTSAGPACAP